MSLYKRPNSKFYWMKFTFDGELIQRSTKCKNRRDAETVERAFRTQLALGKLGIKPKAKAPMFGEVVQDFLKWYKATRPTTTYTRFEFSFKPLLKFFGSSVKVDEIEPKDIETYILQRQNHTSRKTKKPITRATVNYEINILKMLFKRLIDSEILDKSPARSVKKLAENDRQFHVITETEQKRYTLAAPPLLADVFNLMLETGLRCGETYRLQKKDIFLDEGYLKVTKGKTASSVRRVPLSENARKILESRIKKFDGDFLFPQNDIDRNKQTDSLIKFHLKTIRTLGFNFRIYDARHTFATRAVESGTDLIVLSAILGHSGLKMMTRYAHPSESHKAEAIRKMETRKVKAV